MTRDEAVARLQKLHDVEVASASDVVDAFAELGMLKFDGASGDKESGDRLLKEQFKRDGFLRSNEIVYVLGVIGELSLKVVRA